MRRTQRQVEKGNSKISMVVKVQRSRLTCRAELPTVLNLEYTLTPPILVVRYHDRLELMSDPNPIPPTPNYSPCCL